MELSKAQESSGMTQEELADKVGIDGSEIYQIESAKSNPSIEMLEKIADSMEMKTLVLFVYTERLTRQVLIN